MNIAAAEAASEGGVDNLKSMLYWICQDPAAYAQIQR